ncbi:MAG: hypothetical protein EBS05_10215 [Proteobacteria bacterium]|nr:hypothetical protein [Pseudomonadota bacterium]
MKEKQKLILKTSDYSLFEQDDFNRDVRPHPKLHQSMKQHGFRPESPIVVVPGISAKFKIKDGAHRFSTAKALGIPVWYTVSENPDVPITDINNAMMQWRLADYVSSYIKQGNEHYLKLKAFADEFNIKDLGSLATVCGTGGHSQELVNGGFKFVYETHARKTMAVISTALQFVPWAKQSKFLRAVSGLLRYTDAVPDVLSAKIRTHPSMLYPCVGVESAMQMLEEIYNYRNQAKAPLMLQFKDRVAAAETKRCLAIKKKS